MDINAQLAALAATLEALTKQYERTAIRLDSTEEKFNTKLDAMGDKLGSKLDGIDSRLNGLHLTISNNTARIDVLEKTQERQQKALIGAIGAIGTAFLGYIKVKVLG